MLTWILGICAGLFALLHFKIITRRQPWGRGTALVVVFGDLGRSPRMQNQALGIAEWLCLEDIPKHKLYSLGSKITQVRLAGIGETSVRSEILNHPKIKVTTFPPTRVDKHRDKFERFYFFGGMVFAFLKLWEQMMTTFWLAVSTDDLRVVLVQCPPLIPHGFVLWFVARMRGAAFAIDCHNYGHTLMPFWMPRIGCYFASVVEGMCFRLADGMLCVTEGMKNDLVKRFRVRSELIQCVYDRPPDSFKNDYRWCERQQIYNKYLSHQIPRIDFPKRKVLDTIIDRLVDENIKDDEEYRILLCEVMDEDPDIAFEELFNMELHERMEVAQLAIKLCKHQKAIKVKCGPVFENARLSRIVVAPTSFTPDEDLTIFFDAIIKYGELSEERFLPRLIAVTTGKGPQLNAFKKKIVDTEDDRVNSAMAHVFAEADEYPLFLSIADVGISLHTSSSGLDLPMKVVDMQGVGIPALFYDYPTMRELCKPGIWAEPFTDADSLAEGLARFFEKPSGEEYQASQMLTDYTKCAIDRRPCGWLEEWNVKAQPVLRALVVAKSQG